MKLEDGYLTYVESEGNGIAVLYLTKYKFGEKPNGEFTVWGDDWDDSPYEHNAGEPYGEYIKVVIQGEFMTPNYGNINSRYSVESINKGAIPWLRSFYNVNYFLLANARIKDIANFVYNIDGTLFTEHNIRGIINNGL